MLTDEDRKLIEKETGVKQEEVHEADQREVRVPNYLNEIQILHLLYTCGWISGQLFSAKLSTYPTILENLRKKAVHLSNQKMHFRKKAVHLSNQKMHTSKKAVHLSNQKLRFQKS